jgi:hypothetical protein
LGRHGDGLPGIRIWQAGKIPLRNMTANDVNHHGKMKSGFAARCRVQVTGLIAKGI